MGRLPRCAIHARIAQHHWLARRAPRVLLLAMVGLVLCMPMSYRAGTVFPHPHAFFQPFIDAATGHSHHDAGELVAGNQPEQTGAFAPFVPLEVPLPHVAGETGVDYRVVDGPVLASAQAAGRTPDTPALTALTAPLEQASGIPTLSLIILLLFAAEGRRAVWTLARAPRGVTPAPEPPPPRLAVV